MPYNKFYRVVLTLIGLLISISLSAWSVGDFYLGNQISNYGARNLAMGNTGVFDTFTPMSMSLNPANVAMLQGRFGLGVTGMFTRNEDNRSIPLYNSFDTFIDDATINANTNIYDDYGFAGYGRYNFNKVRLGLGIHYLPVVNFKGTFDEEVRNNRNSDNDGYPEIIAYNEIDNTGKLNALGFTLGGGYEIDDKSDVQIGFTVNSINGESEYQKSIKWTEFAMLESINHPSLRRNVLPDSLYINKSDLSGIQVKLGTAFKLNSRLGLGLAYTLKSEFDRDSKLHSVYGPDTTLAIPATSTNLQPVITDSEVSDKYILPAKLRFGFNYQPRNIMKTYFNAEIEYTKWSDIADYFDDSWDIHVGVEHSVTNRIPLRLGFQSLTEWQVIPDYNNLNDDGLPALFGTKIVTPSITAGSSVNVMKNLVLDIGLIFSWREYQALDLFRDGYYNDKRYTGLSSYIVWPNQYIFPTDRGWENPDKIRETITQLSAGLTWTW